MNRTCIVLASVLGLVAAVLFLQFFVFRDEIPAPPADALYRNSALSTPDRIEDLLTYMTLEEKIGQIALVEKNSLLDTDDVSDYGLGALLSGAGAKPEENTLEGWSQMVSGFVAASRKSRLGIPILYGVDAIHGHGNVPGATVFPHFIGLGATGDEALVEDVARATARELAATGIYWSFSPTLDLPQDIRWGRVYESFSDDPELVSKLGVAYLNGLKNQESGVKGSKAATYVLATPKHYIGAGGMVWGSSSNEDFSIDQGVTLASEEKLRTDYFLPFKAVIDAGAQSIMIGLNSWGDTKLSAQRYLIQDVLKGELGFQGFTVSDWYGVYEISGNKYWDAVSAINAGVDMVMLPYDYETFVRDVSRAVQRGDIEEARIDDAVRRILRAKFDLGLFDQEEKPGRNEIGQEEHRALARRAVSASLVLLKNAGQVLPIDPEVDHIRVAGSAADNVGRQAGAWTVEWQGIDGNWLPGATSILEGFREVASEDVVIEFNQSADFDSDAAPADIGIAVVGEMPYAEGWGDNPNPSLSPEDLAVIDRLKESSRRVAVVLVTGRPLFITDEVEEWDALVSVWLPGSEGGGVADVLFGERSFTGTLPLPWPAHTRQLPIHTDGSTTDGSPVLFPRYYGIQTRI